jgi:hypothetical protein
MEISLSGQLATFAMAALLGGFAGLFYDALAIIAMRVRFNFIRALFDVLFCLSVVFALFGFAMTVGGGELRLFALLAFGLGALAYYLTLSGFVRSIGGFVLDTLIKAVLFLLSPLFALYMLIKKIHKYFTNLFHFCKKRVIMVFRAGEGRKARARLYRKGDRFDEKEKAYRHFRESRFGGRYYLRPVHSHGFAEPDKHPQNKRRLAGKSAGRSKREEYRAPGGYQL